MFYQFWLITMKYFIESKFNNFPLIYRFKEFKYTIKEQIHCEQIHSFNGRLPFHKN